jgi:hypothetical protein
MSNTEYWIVAKMDYTNRYGEIIRSDDQIIFISIPQGIRRGLKKEEILLTDLEKLGDAPIDCNIFLNQDYPPFQRCQTLRDVYVGFPVEFVHGKTKQFIVDALLINSKSIYDYYELIKNLNSEQEPERSVATKLPKEQNPDKKIINE